MSEPASRTGLRFYRSGWRYMALAYPGRPAPDVSERRYHCMADLTRYRTELVASLRWDRFALGLGAEVLRRPHPHATMWARFTAALHLGPLSLTFTHWPKRAARRGSK